MSKRLKIGDWLEQKLVNLENGIIIEERDFYNFEAIQDFIEAHDLPRKTPAIYYQAFPEESTTEFLSILEEELRSKLGNAKLYADSSLAEIITAAALKMVIIDRSHLHPQQTTRKLTLWLNRHNVCLISVGLRSQSQTEIIDDTDTTQISQKISQTVANVDCTDVLFLTC